MDADHHRDPNPTDPATATGAPGAQLRLLDTERHPEWCLDESTREVGRRGIRAARAALASSRRRDPDVGAEHPRTSTAA